MVALTGGLFVSVIVFAMARQGTRFYQQESRIAEATLAATIGMQRLRADIGRAGYMSSAYIGAVEKSDPNLCLSYVGSPVNLLGTMRSIDIRQAPLDSDADPTKAGITPDSITVSGAYQNPDRFIAGYILFFNGLQIVTLQTDIGALARYRYLLPTTQRQSLLDSLFPAGRLLRAMNQSGHIAYAVIDSTSPTGDPSNSLPTIRLRTTPTIPLQDATSPPCNFAGVGVEVNVVNFYRYRIVSLKSDPTYKSRFGQLYSSTANPADTFRTELIREELDPTTGKPFTDVPPEIVAEYAVDLKFEGLVAPDVGVNQVALTMTPTAASVYDIASIGVNGQPQRIRSLRARLSVRSREADRTSNIPGAAVGRYRIPVNGSTNIFARVRTIQTDIAIPNHFGLVR